MTISFPSFANGDTNYVAKLNGNFTSIGSYLDGINKILSGSLGSVSSAINANTALFGATASVIGAASYGCTGSSSTLTVAAGFAWKPSLSTVVAATSSHTLDFSGQSAATYYIEVDGTGAPSRSATNSGEALYSVAWTGSAFGAITLLAAIVWGAADDIAAQVSTALGATYLTLDARLEASETLAVAGDLARLWQTGRLSLSVAGAADVTLSATQANNAVLNFTGALTGNINVIVPLGTNPREWTVTNNTTGAFSLTVKGASGTGISVAQGGFSKLYQDGTNVLSVSGSGAGFGTVTSVGVSVPTFLSATGAVTTSGTIAITLSGTALPIANGGTGGTSASAARTALGLGTSATLDVDTDAAMAANSDTRVPSQKAVASYIASFMSNFDTKPECAYASTSALPTNTYSNGTSGVGATLTGTVNGPLLIDGVTLVAGAVGDRILVAGEATDSHNGWFTLTQLGVVALSPYILTRDPLSDQAAEISPGYLTAVKAPSGLTAGSSNDGKLFISACPSPFTVGTSSLNFAALGAAGGSVTSVAATVPAEFTISGSPITSSGTLAISKATQSANLVWAGPTTGSAAAPTFRALVAADLPVQPFDVHAFYPGLPTASAIVVRIPIARAVTFAANFAGSYFAASANATATTVFDVQKNGSSIGSISIAASGTTATFTTTSGTSKSFAAGDVLAIIAPGTPDTTLANPGFVLAGTR